MKKINFYFAKIILFFSLISIFLVQNTFAEENQKDDHLSSNELKLGERLFYGLINTGENTINCASCHNTSVIDTFNWNPSILEIALSTQNMDSTTFANLLLNPVTKRMSEVHANIPLSGEQIILIRQYIDTYRTTGLKEQKKLVTRLSLFILLIVIFIAAFVDLSLTKFIKYKVVHGLIILIVLVFIFKILYEDAAGLGRTKDYAPLQPIKFSHQVHATSNKIDCMYCHHTAETAKSAGIPSTNVCMNCHQLVREGTYSGRFEIQKILTHMDQGQAVKWIRVHKLPDHVFFSHAQHVGVGQLECKDCHGLVEDMHLLKQENDLSMGWCLDCHRTQKVDFFENKYYENTFEEYHEQLKNNTTDSLTVAQLGGEDCMKCHY
ncbi:MAG TPA: hypothetical protein DCG75_00685 [Bacteroidales bacterium]|nr:hypothetical protein [Bacteroidales bacterium]